MASFAFHDSVYIRPYLVFVTIQASLLVTKANEILEMNVGGSKLPFSEAASFLTSCIPLFSRHVRSWSISFNLPIYSFSHVSQSTLYIGMTMVP